MLGSRCTCSQLIKRCVLDTIFKSGKCNICVYLLFNSGSALLKATMQNARQRLPTKTIFLGLAMSKCSDTFATAGLCEHPQFHSFKFFKNACTLLIIFVFPFFSIFFFFLLRHTFVIIYTLRVNLFQ